MDPAADGPLLSLFLKDPFEKWKFRVWIVSNVSAESKNIVKKLWVENLEGENRSHTDI